MEAVVKQVQETLTVMAGIQQRQASVIRAHGEWLEEHDKSMALHRKRMDHIDERLAEITDKLDGLIGFMDGFTRRNPPSPPAT